MFKQINVLNEEQIRELKEIAASAQFVDGKISNPHSRVKNNLQLHDATAYEKTSRILTNALASNREFMDFAMPLKFAPPLITRYTPGMEYGLHPDSAQISLPDGPLRPDVSCTVFLNDPDQYDGGALRVTLGEAELKFKGEAGTAIVYPSYTLHEVEKVTKGERLVAITFIQSRIQDVTKRNVLYDINEVAALEGLKMSHENFTRLQSAQFNLMRMWSK